MQGGLQNTALEKHEQPLSHLPYMQTNLILAAGEMFDGFSRSGHWDAQKVAEVKGVHGAAVEECKAGVAFRMAKFMAIGRKASQ